jgi:hypothetical protein
MQTGLELGGPDGQGLPHCPQLFGSVFVFYTNTIAACHPRRTDIAAPAAVQVRSDSRTDAVAAFLPGRTTMVIAALPYRAAAFEGAILTGRAATHRGSGKRAAIFGSGATVVEAALLPAAQVCLRVATRQPRRTTELGLVRGVAGVLPWRAALAGCTGLRKNPDSHRRGPEDTWCNPVRRLPFRRGDTESS